MEKLPHGTLYNFSLVISGNLALVPQTYLMLTLFDSFKNYNHFSRSGFLLLFTYWKPFSTFSNFQINYWPKVISQLYNFSKDVQVKPEKQSGLLLCMEW
jgi:hypothetical protein